jgi:hypothetical protein
LQQCPVLPQQFSESLHLASPALSEKSSAVLVPAFEMTKANPVRVAAGRADVDRAGFGAVVVTAGVILYPSTAFPWRRFRKHNRQHFWIIHFSALDHVSDAIVQV